MSITPEGHSALDADLNDPAFRTAYFAERDRIAREADPTGLYAELDIPPVFIKYGQPLLVWGSLTGDQQKAWRELDDQVMVGLARIAVRR